MESSKKKLADQFIQKHHGAYGVLAQGLIAQEGAVLSPLLWSLDSHYKFGFNGLYFNERKGPHCLYSVDYGDLKRLPLSFEKEVVLALQQISDHLGKIAIPATNSLLSLFLQNMVKKSGISAQRVEVPFERAEFERYIQDFSAQNNVGDIEVIWRSYPERFTDLPLIYESRPLRVVDHNYDIVQNCETGLKNWGVYEMEKNTCIHRHLQHQQRPGIPNVFVWSPELMAAQLTYPEWLRLLKEGQFAQSNYDVETAVLRHLAEVSEIWEESSSLDVYKNQKEQMNKELRWKRWGITNDASNYPLVRLIKKWSLAYPICLSEYEEVYGSVL